MCAVSDRFRFGRVEFLKQTLIISARTKTCWGYYSCGASVAIPEMLPYFTYTPLALLSNVTWHVMDCLRGNSTVRDVNHATFCICDKGMKRNMRRTWLGCFKTSRLDPCIFLSMTDDERPSKHGLLAFHNPSEVLLPITSPRDGSTNPPEERRACQKFRNLWVFVNMMPVSNYI